jgi:hypothetical protein
MAQTQTQTQTVDATGITFLCDWLGDDHRPLANPARDHARRYIEAIIAHDALVRDLSADSQLTCAGMLWRTFRETYDDLRGPFARSEKEDVARALGRL